MMTQSASMTSGCTNLIEYKLIPMHDYYTLVYTMHKCMDLHPCTHGRPT